MNNLQENTNNATWQPIETAPIGYDLILAGVLDHEHDWRIKIGHRDTDRPYGRFYIYGASWEPLFWMPLPPTPNKEI